VPSRARGAVKERGALHLWTCGDVELHASSHARVEGSNGARCSGTGIVIKLDGPAPVSRSPSIPLR